MGYGLIEVTGSELRLLSLGVVKLAGFADHYERLQKIHERITALIDTYHPDAFAIEAPFFGKNVQSMLKLGRAQGVAIAAAMQAGLTVNEYSPKKVKQSITGNGNSDKEQVWQMLQRILAFKEKPRFFDATDGLAVALCHHYQSQSPLPAVKGGGAKKVKGWDAFLAQNPGRVKAATGKKGK
jgi:crossover junction endodeoxyribonuclease RuvC